MGIRQFSQHPVPWYWLDSQDKTHGTSRPIGSCPFLKGAYMKPYYQQSTQDVFQELHTSPKGLSPAQVVQNQETYGINELVQEKPASPLKIFLGQFKDLLVIVLIIAAIISAFSGELISTLVILVVITLNAILGTAQEVQAQKSLESLKSLSSPHVKVIRDGRLTEIESRDLTVGDIVYVEAGDVIEGDGRLFEAAALQVNESALTGEPVPVEKTTAPIDREVQINDQTDMVFSSGLVTNGTGKYICTAVGMDTQIGKIAGMINEAKERKTPLQKSLEDFSKKLTIYIGLLCVILLFLHVFVNHEPFLQALMVAVALAVAAIPEALNSIVTIVLSIATQKMVKNHAIMKKLDAVESLGCISVICSDKTGTLTQNKMTVMEVFTDMTPYTVELMDARENYPQEILLKAARLNANAVVNPDGTSIGDPTEIALIDMFNQYQKAHPEFVIKAERVEEVPFDSERKLMSVSSRHHIYTKGAPDELLKRCTAVLMGKEKRPMTQQDRDLILTQNDQYASQGLRVLGFAYRDLPEDAEKIGLADEQDLCFVGLVAEQDPPRVESAAAVHTARKAGIKPVMITGDHVVTARAIAEKIGIYQPGDLAVEGNELAHMSDAELADKLSSISVYARVAPEHKIRIVKAWQEKGDIVAMTGDGVNDAPALKAADIGIAMGITGTEVSKDAAKMILTDDNFATIVKAIESGRNVYNNIKNAIIYLLSGNLSAIITVVVTSLVFLPDPFTAVQLLFINLVTDSLPAIAIGMEPDHPDVIDQKPRRSDESILNRDAIAQIGIEGIIIFLAVMASYLIGLKISAGMATTMAFSTLTLSRLLHGFSQRGSKPVWELPFNKFSVYAFLAGGLLLMAILNIPALQPIFDVTPMPLVNAALVVLFSLASFAGVQLYKILSSRSH